jgi:hypothetical protein
MMCHMMYNMNPPTNEILEPRYMSHKTYKNCVGGLVFLVVFQILLFFKMLTIA